MAALFRFLIIFSLSIFSLSSYAVTVTDLYTASIPVASENTQAQNQGIQTALQQVLVKISGSAQTLQNKIISKNIQSSATNYVKEYSYATNPAMPGVTLLNVSFQPKAINTLLQQNNLPIWSTDRPLLAAWISNTQGSQTQLIGTPSATLPWIATLLSAANQRGLPIVLPLLDATDVQVINPAILQQNNISVLQNASNRYNADGLITLQINQTNPTAISTQWNVTLPNKNIHFTLTGNNLAVLMTQGVNQLTDQLAQQFAVTTNAQTTQSIQLQINGINSVGQYAELDHYLRNLTGVTTITLESLSATHAVFNLTLSAPLATIQQQLNLSHILSPVATPAPTPTAPANNPSTTPANNTSQPNNPVLIYQYLPH